MSNETEVVQDIFTKLPPLSECHILTNVQKTALCNELETLQSNPAIEHLSQQLSDSIGAGTDLRLSKLKYLREHSVYLSDIEINFEVKWDEKSTENPPILIKAVNSIWLAKKKLLTIKEEIQSIIFQFCPPAYFMTTLELDQVWEESYTPFDAQIASSRKFESKDTHVNSSSNWIDILINKLHDGSFISLDNKAFNPLLFIAVKLHYTTGKLIAKCGQFHIKSTPRALPALESILEKCPAILQNLALIQELVEKKPVCNILQDASPSYTPGVCGVEELRKRAKEFQTLYASLTDDLEGYLSICQYTNLRNNYDEIFLIRSNEDFDLDKFEESLTAIQDVWDLGLDQNLRHYVLQLEILSICDKFQNELSLGIEFLCKYECSKYPDVEIMNEHKKAIQNFIFSSHWIDSRQQEKTKLIDYIRELNLSTCTDEELEIFSFKTAMRLGQIIENDFKDFTNLYKTVIEYYDLGIEKWKEFLQEVRDFDDNLSRKNYLLASGFIKFQDASKFPKSVKELRIESAELERFSEAHTNLTSLGDQLCISCEGGCQEFIQNKLAQLGEHTEELRMQAAEVYRELEPLVLKIIELDENINKVEEILMETEANIYSKYEEYSKAKSDAYMNYLKSRISSLKKRTSKLSVGHSQLDPLLNIDALDLSVILVRYQEAEKKLNTLLEFLCEKLEKVMISILEKTRSQLLFGESNLDSYEKFFQSLQDESFSEDRNDVTKRLHELEDFFNDDYILEIQASIDNLTQCSKELIENEVKEELINIEESLTKLQITVRSTKILMHFAITFRELHEVLKLRETFIQVSDNPFYMADKIGFVTVQIEGLFGEDFKICQTYYKQLRSRYNEYLSDDNQPPVLPLSLEVVSRLESQMRERLEALEISFANFNSTFKDVEKCVNQFRVNSQNMLTLADKLETAFSQKENTTIRDSSVLETQCNTWELLLLEGQSFLTQYDQSFEDACHIYETLSPSPKVVFVKNIFAKANEYLDQLKSSLNLYQAYQADLKLNEDRLSTLSNNFSHFYTEMRFPSLSINGTAADQYIQRSEEFKNEYQVIKNAVRRLRIGIPELQAGSHEIVEYCIIEEERLKLLEEKLPEWQNKINGLSYECQNSASETISILEPRLSDDKTNEHSSFEFISQDSDHDSGAFHLSTGPVQILSEENQKLQDKLTRLKRWLKRKEKAHIMTSDISIKLSEAQLQKSEIDITKVEFERKKLDHRNLLTDESNLPVKLRKYHKEIELLFNQFETSIAKRCEKASNRISSLLELHLLISLSEKRLISIKTNSEISLYKQYTLQEQIQRSTELRNELKDCEQDYICKIREQFTDLTRDSAGFFPNLDNSPETSIDSFSESDTDEKQPKPNAPAPNSQTSFLLPAIPCREQILAIEASYKELFYVITEQINSLTERKDNANEISNKLRDINEKADSFIHSISDKLVGNDSTQQFDILKEEHSTVESEYISMQQYYAPDHNELRLQRDAKESIDNLQGVINENISLFHVNTANGHDQRFDSIFPFNISEYLFEPNESKTSPILNPDEIPLLIISQEEGDIQNTGSTLGRCFGVISECYEFYKQFSSSGPHLEISSKVFTTDVQSKYTDCHTEVMSILLSNGDPTGFVNAKVHEWLEVLQTVCEILKKKIESRSVEWRDHVASYDALYGYINAIESELEDFETQTIEDEVEFENALETTLQYFRDSIEKYNEFSPKMYQLIVCESCEDDSCQGWREKLDNCRDKLISIKAQFVNLTQPKPTVPELSERVTLPEDLPITAPVPANEISHADEPVTGSPLMTSDRNDRALDAAVVVEKNSRLIPIKEIHKHSTFDAMPGTNFVSFIFRVLLITGLVYGLFTMNYIIFVNNNPPNIPK